MAIDAEKAQRVELPRWANARTILGAVLFLVSLTLGLRVLDQGRMLVPVWVAATDLSAAASLQAEHLEVAEVRLPGDLLEAYARPSSSLEGMTLAVPVRAGEMIPVTALASSREGSAHLMTLPVEPEHAVGGSLRAGDRVDVYATFSADQERATTLLIAAGVEVVNIVSGGSVAMDPTLSGITIKADQDTVPRLTFALRSGLIDVVKVIGPPETRNVVDVRREDLVP